MYSVWEVAGDQREFIAVFKDRRMAWLFTEALRLSSETARTVEVEVIERKYSLYEIVDMEPEEGR